jgi:hypothetical protein
LNTNASAPSPVASAVASAVRKTLAVVTLPTIARQGGGRIGGNAELGLNELRAQRVLGGAGRRASFEHNPHIVATGASSAVGTIGA